MGEFCAVQYSNRHPGVVKRPALSTRYFHIHSVLCATHTPDHSLEYCTLRHCEIIVLLYLTFFQKIT